MTTASTLFSALQKHPFFPWPDHRRATTEKGTRKRVFAGVLSIALLLLFLSPPCALGMFRSESRDQNRDFQIERHIPETDAPEPGLALYDVGKEGKNAVSGLRAVPPSKHFVSADVIEKNMPLHIAIRETVDVDEKLQNLVYANAKLEKLLSEYAGLQQRSRGLMDGLSVPSMNTRPSGSTGVARRPGPTIYNQNKQLHEKRLRISPELEWATPGTDRPTVSFSNALLGLEQNSDDGEESGLRSQFEWDQARFQHSGNRKDISSRSSVGLQRGSPPTVYRTNEELPWILQKFSDAYNFFKGHKLVSATILVLFITAYILISAMVKR